MKRNADPGMETVALDTNYAEATRLGMTDAEADAWSAFADFVSILTTIDPSLYNNLPHPVDVSVATLRAWLLARPAERELARLIVDPEARPVR